jgi:hypothetical protein
MKTSWAGFAHTHPASRITHHNFSDFSNHVKYLTSVFLNIFLFSSWYRFPHQRCFRRNNRRTFGIPAAVLLSGLTAGLVMGTR